MLKTIFFIFFILLTVFTVYAEKSFVFLAPVHYSPWVELSNGKVVGGVYYKYKELLEKELGESFILDAVPFTRFISVNVPGQSFDITLVKKEILLTNPNYVMVPAAFNSNHTYLIHTAKLNDCSSIKKMSVIREIKRNSQFYKLCKIQKKIKMDVVSTFNQRYKMLQFGRVQAIIVGLQELVALTDSELNELTQNYKWRILDESRTHFFIKASSKLNNPKYLNQLNEISEKNNSSSRLNIQQLY